MAGPERTSVYVADDHPAYRTAVGRVIDRHPELELVGDAADGAQALEEIRRLRPHVLILDLGLPSLSGLEILQAIGRERLPTRVVVLSGEADGTFGHEALELGAYALLPKGSPLATLSEVVAAAAPDRLAPERIDELRTLFDPAELRAMLQEVAGELSRAYGQIVAADATDASGLVAAAHSLKGGARLVGAEALAAAAEAFGGRAREGGAVDELDAAVVALGARLAQAEAAIAQAAGGSGAADEHADRQHDQPAERDDDQRRAQ